jgi:hypothetical protein
MDWKIIGTVLAAVVLIVGLFLFRQRAKLKMKGPGGEIEFDGSNQPPPPTPDLEVEDVGSSEGKAGVRDEVGGRMKVKGVHGKKGAEVVRSGGTGGPKA